MMQNQFSRLLLAATFAAALAACGGGGGGGSSEPRSPFDNTPRPGDLLVEFEYSGLNKAKLWDTISIAPSKMNFKGKTPTCSTDSGLGGPLSKGEMPPGLKLDPKTCVISGRILKYPSHLPTVFARVDGYDSAVIASPSLQVEGLPTLKYEQPQPMKILRGEPVSIPAPKIIGYTPEPGDDVTYSLFFSTDTLPKGLSLNEKTGVISGQSEVYNSASTSDFFRLSLRATITRQGVSNNLDTATGPDNTASPGIKTELHPLKITYPVSALTMGQPFSVKPVIDMPTMKPGDVLEVDYTVYMTRPASCKSQYNESGLVLNKTTGEFTGIVKDTSKDPFGPSTDGCALLRFFINRNGTSIASIDTYWQHTIKAP